MPYYCHTQKAESPKSYGLKSDCVRKEKGSISAVDQEKKETAAVGDGIRVRAHKQWPSVAMG